MKQHRRRLRRHLLALALLAARVFAHDLATELAHDVAGSVLQLGTHRPTTSGAPVVP